MMNIHLLALSSSSLDNPSSSPASVAEALACPAPLLLLTVLVLFDARPRPGVGNILSCSMLSVCGISEMGNVCFDTMPTYRDLT